MFFTVVVSILKKEVLCQIEAPPIKGAIDHRIVILDEAPIKIHLPQKEACKSK